MLVSASSGYISVLVSMYSDVSGGSVVGEMNVVMVSMLSVDSCSLLSASFAVRSVEVARVDSLVKGYGVKVWICFVET